MSSINNLNGSSPLSSRLESYAATRRPVPSEGSASVAQTTDRADRVELSAQARALASSPTPVRESLVNRIRAEIENGTYDIDSKLDKAVTELAKDLGPINDLYA
jgi:flagellar biosynthesis anti-sigma factor FlgM